MPQDKVKSQPPFPWRACMAFGLGVLRLSPSDFWDMTPSELAASWEGVYGIALVSASQINLESLMREFPDRAHSKTTYREEGHGD